MGRQILRDGMTCCDETIMRLGVTRRLVFVSRTCVVLCISVAMMNISNFKLSKVDLSARMIDRGVESKVRRRGELEMRTVDDGSPATLVSGLCIGK